MPLCFLTRKKVDLSEWAGGENLVGVGQSKPYSEHIVWKKYIFLIKRRKKSLELILYTVLEIFLKARSLASFSVF